MPLQENVATRVAYKLHTASAMTPNVLLVPATDPASSGGQELRRVTSTLKKTADSYQSNEIRTSRQIADFRLGTKRIQGQITGELSPVTYFALYEAAFRATKAATFNATNTDFTSITADGPTSKLTVAVSTWAAKGFRVGDIIRSADLTSNSNINFLIYSLSGVDAFVTPAPTTAGADSVFTISRIGTKISIPASSHVKRLFAFEHFYQDSDTTHLFTECRITGSTWALPATGLVTTTISVLGRALTKFSGGSSPFFTAPTAQGADGITASVNGKIVVAGAVVGVVTAVDINLQMAADAPSVVGQDFVPEIFLGRSIVTGRVSVLYSDDTFLTLFDGETTFELLVTVNTTSAANTPFITFTLPLCKFTDFDMPLQGEGGLVQALPFQALEKPTTTGYDNTTIAMIDSTAV